MVFVHNLFAVGNPQDACNQAIQNYTDNNAFVVIAQQQPIALHQHRLSDMYSQQEVSLTQYCLSTICAVLFGIGTYQLHASGMLQYM